MSDAPGNTSWGYDARGQVITQTVTVNTRITNTFKTEWGYNSAGLQTFMKYPTDNTGGKIEQVDYSYLPQLSLNSMSGS